MAVSYHLKVVFSTLLLLESLSSFEIDENGYVVYCPCMGRFGNQADHFLGSLSFAHGLNRTLILPGWVEFPRESVGHSVRIPFDRYFNVESLRAFHRVITMEDFMENLAPIIWPPEKRVVFCYSADRMGPKKNDCNAKDGNPFGPFWDSVNVDFVSSEFYGSIGHSTSDADIGRTWSKRYHPRKFPVLAFTGAPASFPVNDGDATLHKFLIWSHYIKRLARQFIDKIEGPWVGIHLRNGIDWVSTCKHVTDVDNLFASPQCLGWNNEHGNLDMDLCYPSKKTILHQTWKVVKKLKAKTLFVASDDDFMIEEFEKYLKLIKPKVSVVKREPSEPHVDLAILAQADHYIGNCVSSFSSFAKRERDAASKLSSFWSLPRPVEAKEEL